MDNTEKNKRIARNTLFLYLRMGVVMLIALYTTKVVLRVLGVEDFGIYNIVCGFVALFGIFNTCFSTSINRFYNYEIGQGNGYGIRTVYNTSLKIQLVLALFVVVLIELVGCWYIENVMVLPAERLSTAKWIFHFAVFSTFFTIIQAPYSAAVIAYEKMDYFALVSVIDAFLKLGIVFSLHYVVGDRLIVYGFLISLISFINFFLYFIYCKYKFPEIRLERGVDKKFMKSMLSFIGWSTLDPLAYTLRDQGLNLVLNLFFGPIVNAAQGIAYQISAVVDNFGGGFSLSFRPQIIQSYSEGQFDRTKSLMLSMSKISYMLHVMIIIPIIIEIHYILHLWLGDNYPSYAIPFTCLILCIKAIGSLNSPISTVVSATGNISKIKIFSAVIISSIIPASIILYKFDNSPSSAYVALLCLTIINQIGCVVFLRQLFPYIKIIEYFRNLILPLSLHTLCVLVIPLLISTLLPPSIWRLIVVFIISVVCTVCVGYMVVLNINERHLILKLIGVFRK